VEPQITQEQIDKMKKELLRKVLSKEAMERLGRVRIANPMLASQLELTLVQMVQNGQARGQITDEQLRGILDSLTTAKKKTNISRR
jgi:programmed cell death protein 5